MHLSIGIVIGESFFALVKVLGLDGAGHLVALEGCTLGRHGEAERGQGTLPALCVYGSCGEGHGTLLRRRVGTGIGGFRETLDQGSVGIDLHLLDVRSLGGYGLCGNLHGGTCHGFLLGGSEFHLELFIEFHSGEFEVVEVRNILAGTTRDGETEYLPAFCEG